MSDPNNEFGLVLASVPEWPLCVNCIHAIEPGPPRIYDLFCGRKTEHPECEGERASPLPGDCGPSGKFFDPKPTTQKEM